MNARRGVGRVFYFRARRQIVQSTLLPQPWRTLLRAMLVLQRCCERSHERQARERRHALSLESRRKILAMQHNLISKLCISMLSATQATLLKRVCHEACGGSSTFSLIRHAKRRPPPFGFFPSSPVRRTRRFRPSAALSVFKIHVYGTRNTT